METGRLVAVTLLFTLCRVSVIEVDRRLDEVDVLLDVMRDRVRMTA